MYFKHNASELTLPEAALLAGLPANPTAYDPVSNPTRALDRRNTVLALMFGQQLITESQYDAARRTPLPSAEGVGLPGTSGPAKYFTEYVKQQLIDYYGSGKVFGGGLKVYTSMNARPPEPGAGGDRQVADAQGRASRSARRGRPEGRSGACDDRW